MAIRASRSISLSNRRRRSGRGVRLAGIVPCSSPRAHARDRDQILGEETPAHRAVGSPLPLVLGPEQAETMLERRDAPFDAGAPTQRPAKPPFALHHGACSR